MSEADRRREILEARARAIACARQEARADGVPVLAFGVGGERYAVRVEEVSQVLEARGLHALPGAPRWLLGALIARSRVVPVLDLRHLLGLGAGGMSDLTRVVVVEQGGESFGLAVEVLEGRLEIPRTPPSAPAAGPLRWIPSARLALLDLARLGIEPPRE